MSNKRWVYKRKYSEKAKKVMNLFRDLRSEILLGKSVTKSNFPRRMPESAYRHLFCYKKPWLS